MKIKKTRIVLSYTGFATYYENIECFIKKDKLAGIYRRLVINKSTVYQNRRLSLSLSYHNKNI